MVGNTEKKEKKKKNPIPFRLNVLFIIVFLLFSILILRLGFVQIVNGETYRQKVEQTVKKTSKLDAARGKIFDSNGRLLVGNESKYAITYTRTKDSTPHQRLELAKKLANYIDPTKEQMKKVTERDKKDYWIVKHGYQQAIDLKLTDQEQSELEDDEAVYDLVLTRISEEDLKGISKHEIEVIAIWRELNQAMNLNPHYVKRGLEAQAFFRIGEHLSSLPGINLAVAPIRVYPNEYEFFLGRVGRIPQGKLDYYLARGYQHNSFVGNGYIERYYEDVLNGTPTKLKYLTDKSGTPLEDPVRIEGQRGHDIVLTINIKLQHELEKMLKEQVKQAMAEPVNRYLDSAYAVVVNPNTGGILALAGCKYEEGEFKDASFGTVYKAFAIGSTQKPATVLAGFETDTLPGTIRDMPIELPLGKDFSSYTNYGLGYVDTVEALEKSSNVYMGFIAANLAGFDLINMGNHYEPENMPGRGSEQLVDAFQTLRNIYSQFGLGIPTQIDLPSEGLGYEGNIESSTPGLIMQFAIGQYDTYTPIQLAQYISTIANDGYRMQFHLLKSVREPAVEEGEIGRIVYQYEPQVLNHISMSDHALNVVQKGLWRVVHGGPRATARAVLGVEPYNKYHIAGKTGTAQVNLDDDSEIETQNELFIGYAPYKDPEVAVAVVVPRDDSGQYHLKIAGRVFQAYFELKK